MDFLEKINAIAKKTQDPFYWDCIEYIQQVIKENKTLKETLELVDPEKFNKPIIIKIENSNNIFPVKIGIAPNKAAAGYAIYQKILDYTENETEKYYAYDESNSTKVTLSLLNQIDMNGKFVFITNFTDICNKSHSQLIEDHQGLLLKIKEFKNKCDNFGKKFIVLINAIYEAPTYKYNLNGFCDCISELYDIPLGNIMIYSGAQYQNDKRIKHVNNLICAIHDFSFGKTLAIYDPLYHYVSLARIARPHRIYATIEILDRKLDKFGHISLGSGWYHDSKENFDLQMVPERHKDRMPLVIDGTIAHGTHHLQWRGEDVRLTHAFVNLVHETSFEHDINPRTWNVPFITEKSTKPFIWGQVPIYNMMAGSIKYIRELGFDLFDDIIDHSYDNELDPMTRIKLVIDQLEKICQWSLEDCVAYKQKNIDRFIKNREVSEHVYNKYIPHINLTNLKVALDSYDH
jgi:hypothetical protein